MDISDHFPIFFVADCNIHIKETKERLMFTRDLSDNFVEEFKYKLRTVSCGSITNFSDTNKAYENFSEIFSSLYNECFPKKKIKLKIQKYNNPWITKGIRKSSKIKQKLFKEFFLKTEMKKMRSYINLTKVFLNLLNIILKGFIIRVKYYSLKTMQRKHGVL